MKRRSLLTAALSAPAVALAGSLPVVAAATLVSRLIADHANAHAAFKRAEGKEEAIRPQLPEPDVVLARMKEGPSRMATSVRDINRHFDSLPEWHFPEREDVRQQKLAEFAVWEQRRDATAAALGLPEVRAELDRWMNAEDAAFDALCAYIPASFAEAARIAAYITAHVEGYDPEDSDWMQVRLMKAWAATPLVS